MGIKQLTFFAAVLTTLLSVSGLHAQINSRVSQQQVTNILRRLETRTDTFRAAVDRRLDNSRLNNTQREDNISAYVDEFENATDDLRTNFNARRATASDINEVMNYAWYIDNAMSRTNLGAGPKNQWNLIRTDLDLLARQYNVNWSWNRTQPPFPQDRWTGRGRQLNGTFRLNTSLSDNVNTVLNQQISNTTQRNRQRQNLERRLTAPQTIAIETSGNTVTMSTDFGEPVTLTADGRTITETNNRGRSTRTTVAMSGGSLTITTEGDRNNDYLVSFTPVGNDRMRVMRRIYLEGQNQMITATSVYDRVSETANRPPVRRPDWNRPGTGGTSDFFIPNGTQLTAVLRNRIVTNVSQAGDRFTMEVTSPSQYRGAIITGRVVQAEGSGRITGRANLAMDFESIQHRGRTYGFSGIIDSAREADGDTINISNEGDVRDSNQTTRTATRAGIGAVLGALIGAIAGGGEGAAIGAGVGAGAGVGSVLIQGRDNLQLEQGTSFTITATGPANVGRR